MPLLTVARAVTAVAALALTPVIGGTLTHEAPATAAASMSAASTSAASMPAASMSAASTSTRGPGATKGLSRECSGVAARIDRIQRLQARLHAGATTRGSLAHLSARIDRAKAAGHADLAKVLSDRLAIRRDVDARLPDMLVHLRDAEQVCAR